MSTDCFTCPQPANYAAIALQLQKTAMDAENCIYPLEGLLRAAANRPTVINVSSAVVNMPAARTRYNPLVTVTFSNSTDTSFSATLPAGVYECGVWFNATASGATTDNSFRQLQIVTRGALDPSTVADHYSVSSVMYESNSGLGMDMLLNTTVVVDGTEEIQVFFVHNNASTINLAAGAILWWTKISDVTIPRVVI